MRQAEIGLAQRLRRFTSSHAACNRRYRAAHAKLRFGPEKLINSTLFPAGDNNTLEIISEISRPNMLISYFTAYLIHYVYNSKTEGKRKKKSIWNKRKIVNY